MPDNNEERNEEKNMYSKAYFVGGLGSVWNTPTKASLLHFRQGTLRQKEKKEKKGTKEDSNSNSNSHKLPKVATSCQSVTAVLTALTDKDILISLYDNDTY